eukprot:SAG22_NODE_111_length_19607_cov_12.696637_18_plen_817_part_00
MVRQLRNQHAHLNEWLPDIWNCPLHQCSYRTVPGQSSGPVDGVIGVFWTDLDPGASVNGGVYYQTFGGQDGGSIVILWNNVRYYEGPTTNTFEATLFAGGGVLLSYLDMTQQIVSASTVSIGYESHDGETGVQISWGLIPPTGTTYHIPTVCHTAVAAPPPSPPPPPAGTQPQAACGWRDGIGESRLVCVQEPPSLWVREIKVFDTELTDEEIAALHRTSAARVAEGQLDVQACMNKLPTFDGAIDHPHSFNWDIDHPSITTSYCACGVQLPDSGANRIATDCFGPRSSYTVELRESMLIMMTMNSGVEPLTFQPSEVFSHQASPVTLELISGPFKGFVTSYCAAGAATTSHLTIVDATESEQGSGSTRVGNAIIIQPGSPVVYMLYASSEGHCHSKHQHLAMFYSAVHALRPCLPQTADISEAVAAADSQINVAWYGTAAQSSVRQEGVPSRAIDGDQSFLGTGDSCTHTNNGPEEWWQVDLGQMYAIDAVKLYQRTDCCQDRLVSATVAISGSADYTLGTPCFVVTSAASASQMISGNCGGYIGQFLTVSLSNDIITICEFEAYGSLVGEPNLDQCVDCPAGTTSDQGSGQCFPTGCTDEWATSFNASAVFDDGSCTYTAAALSARADINFDQCVVDTDTTAVPRVLVIPQLQQWIVQGREMLGVIPLDQQMHLYQNASLVARGLHFQSLTPTFDQNGTFVIASGGQLRLIDTDFDQCTHAAVFALQSTTVILTAVKFVQTGFVCSSAIRLAEQSRVTVLSGKFSENGNSGGEECTDETAKSGAISGGARSHITVRNTNLLVLRGGAIGRSATT